ncbi:hypothetical protein [Halospeciosus flavus]|uniref:hypothetical protein n=1 Tax=Halospeciosus flavus TaxID=3032283 RepID=UPI00360CA55E
MTPREQVAYLFGSSNRPTLLRALHEDPRRPSELTTDYDVSRATVQRTLAGFCERDWTRRDGHTYRTTLAGDLVLERYDDLLDAAHLVDSTGDLLQTLGASARGLSTEMLADATVVTAESNRPHAPFEFYRDYLLDVDVDHCLSVVPVTNDFYGEAHQSLAERVSTRPSSSTGPPSTRPAGTTRRSPRPTRRAGSTCPSSRSARRSVSPSPASTSSSGRSTTADTPRRTSSGGTNPSATGARSATRPWPRGRHHSRLPTTEGTEPTGPLRPVAVAHRATSLGGAYIRPTHVG